MSVTISCSTLLVLLVVLNNSVQGEANSDASSTPTPTTLASAITSNTTLPACSGGQLNPPECTKCPNDSKVDNGRCIGTKGDAKPASSTRRRAVLIFVTCLFTVFLLLTLLAIYGRLNQQRHRRVPTETRNIGSSLDATPTGNSRWSNLLRRVGLGRFSKRGRFNFFSISNNDSALGAYRQPDSSRSQLNENPDEALLFDDPYADGGFNQANPYRSLTLAVT